MIEQRVEVWGKAYTVTVEQKSKSVWMAVGDYMGKSIRVVDRNRGAALKSWCRAASYKGN
jgi:hypothetical protein